MLHSALSKQWLDFNMLELMEPQIQKSLAICTEALKCFPAYENTAWKTFSLALDEIIIREFS